MKKILFGFLFIALAAAAQAQFKNILKKPLGKDTGTTYGLGSLLSKNNSDVAAGLQEALAKGVETGTGKLSATDGFFKNEAVKILLPPDAQKVEKALRSAGLGSQVDEAVLSMNRAAEDASKSAAPVFLDAVKNMSFSDALGILKGNDSSATMYLKTKTTDALTAAFKPIVDSSIQKTDATKYWRQLTTTYNQIPFVKKLQSDLTDYITGKTLQGLFHEIAVQEKEIRNDPAARTTDLLKKIFAKK